MILPIIRRGGVFTTGEYFKYEGWSDDLQSLVDSAERVLVPKSRDAVSGVGAFTAVTGIEVPDTVWEEELVRSAGRTFRLVPGADMPGQITADLGDVAICSTEFLSKAERGELRCVRVGNAMCRYSLIGQEPTASEMEKILSNSSWAEGQEWNILATFPRLLNETAAKRGLPLRALDIPLSGKGEAAMAASGLGMMAERVVSGLSAARFDAREFFVLTDVYPELLFRRDETIRN